jgi:hypothetical protein
MKGQNWKWKARRNLGILLVIAILSSLPAGSLALAEEPLSADILGWGDDGILEVGTEWIAYFTQCPANNIPCEQPQCEGFYDELVDAGWTGRFNYGNCSAWAKDFKRSAVGGSENSVVDSADIVLFCDHGGGGTWDSFWNKWLSYIHFGCDGPDNDCNVSPGEAYMSYGDKDLEWLAFKACSVLSDGGPAPYRNRGYWASTMNGLHLLLGFKNSSSCSSQFGEKWAEYMLGWCPWWWPFGCLRPPYTIKQAWFEAVDDTQPGGVCARVLAEVQDNYNDHLWGKGYVSPDPVHNSVYWYWDHCSCTPPPLQLGEEVLAQIETLPVYEVADREVNEEYVLEIASAFGMTGTVEDVGTDGEYYYLVHATEVDTYTLQVDIASGGYKYRNLSEIEVSPEEPPELPTAEEAVIIGNEFFTGPGEDLPGAAYRTGGILTSREEQVEVEMAAPESGILQEQELSRIPVNVSLSYGRVITPAVGVRTALGLRYQPQTLSLVGPGARIKMYLGDLNEILGVQGGSRDIQTTGQEVTIMDADKVWDMFLADPSIVLASIPLVYDEVVKTEETLGYYEQSQSETQKELIPAWIFTVDFYTGGELLEEGVLIYVPAAAEYLPPEVAIEAPTTGDVFNSGQTVTFSGSVVQFGKPPFTYNWYSDHDGFLGSEATITAPLTAAIREGEAVSHTITLQVTDANGQQSAASTTVFVKPTIYLPLVRKNR